MSESVLPDHAPSRVDAAAGRRLLGVAGFGAVGLGFTVVYHQLGVGLPCPFLMLTGWWCPFCGATRMAAAVLDGNLAAAMHWNPVVFVGLILLAVATVGWIVEFLTRRQPPWRRWVERVPFGYWFGIIVSVMVVWTLARNVARLLLGL